MNPAHAGASSRNQLARASTPFRAVLSPYHLTTREPAALVAAQIAESLTTLLLAPGNEARESVQRTAARSPAYRSFMRSWEWAIPLFEEGVVSSLAAGIDPVDDVRDACRRLYDNPAFAALLPYLRSEVFEDETEYLRAASIDILKAGPDPAVSVPITAGLDRFASEVGAIAIRSGAASVVQRHETQLGRVVFRATIPVIRQGSAERVLLSRALLDEARRDLAGAVTESFRLADPGPVRRASVRYADAFEAELEDLTAPPGPLDDDEVRVIVGEASLVGMELPIDAALHASVSAATGKPTRADNLDRDHDPVCTLLIRSVGGR